MDQGPAHRGLRTTPIGSVSAVPSKQYPSTDLQVVFGYDSAPEPSFHYCHICLKTRAVPTGRDA